MNKILHYTNNDELCIEGISCSTLIRQIPTPFYVYSHGAIEKNCSEVIELTRNFELLPCYALKANYNPKLLQHIHGFGFGADVVSGGELFFALKAGFPPQEIVFAGVGKTAQEIEYAIRTGIHSINVESESELRVIEKTAAKLKKKVRIAFRVNPDINPKTHPYISTGIHSSKFGITRELAMELFKRASAHPFLLPDGIHVHIGSQIEEEGPYLETVNYLLKMKHDLEQMHIPISYLDLGGGIGINYYNQLDEADNRQTYLSAILPKMLKPLKGTNVKLLIELGRSIIGSAGFLITKVLYVKHTPHKNFIIVDAAMNNLVRPSLYQAYHQILPLQKSNGEMHQADVVGPVCETSDFLARDRELPVVKEGDYLLISGAGAYGQALASEYNLRPMIPEYLIQNEHYTEIYKGDTVQSIAERYIWD
jgi:diaminopimelate decarboxylase